MDHSARITRKCSQIRKINIMQDYGAGNIEDFGLRQFSDNDDWIGMVPGKRE